MRNTWSHLGFNTRVHIKIKFYCILNIRLHVQIGFWGARKLRFENWVGHVFNIRLHIKIGFEPVSSIRVDVKIGFNHPLTFTSMRELCRTWRLTVACMLKLDLILFLTFAFMFKLGFGAHVSY